jgi:hypothetical protein
MIDFNFINRYFGTYNFIVHHMNSYIRLRTFTICWNQTTWRIFNRPLCHTKVVLFFIISWGPYLLTPPCNVDSSTNFFISFTFVWILHMFLALLVDTCKPLRNHIWLL